MKRLSKDAVNWITVDESGEGQRIDNFLARHLKGVPKSHVYRILRSGEVRLNKGRAKPEARLASGDTIRVPPIRTGQPQGPSPDPIVTRSRAMQRQAARLLEPRVVYEDEDLLAVDKPSGLAVHGGSGIAHGLIEQLRAARPDARFLELVHRLDRETSGVLLVAKKRAALVRLHAALREGQIDKRYLVLVRGRWRDEKRVVRLALHRFSTQQGERRVRVDDEGREAVTTFRRVKVWPRHDPPLALLEAELETGRTHQIRVHLTHLGFPLAGDDKYGDFAWNRALRKQGLDRMFLHAQRLAFAHPIRGEPMMLESALPPDLAAFLATLDADQAPHQRVADAHTSR
ncbi:MAG TPA: RluA family pseudouridine synthase [Casimicrobiaceae bacterium]|nr:RluA family pseudouridine synthase [Casimicrobiaceae bacterium]